MPSFFEPPAGEAVIGSDILPTWIQAAIQRAPLYPILGERSPAHWHETDDLVETAAFLGDPFGGRHDPVRTPVVFNQMAQDMSLFWALDAADLGRIARELASCWSDLGIVPGERLALYDYSSSPMVAYASRAFMPHLERGAADLLSCLPICNDGLPELADRCTHILEYVQPSTLFMEADVVEPLLRVLDRSTPRPRRLVVTADERLVTTDQIEDWQKVIGAPVVQMLRCDAALFFAAPCPAQPLSFHPSPAFVVEAFDPEGTDGTPSPGGRISVTNLAIRSSIVVRYLTRFRGSVSSGQCSCGRDGSTVVITDD